MPQCTICKHKDRKLIEAALIAPDANLREIAGRYGVSKSALDRHLTNGHIARSVMRKEEIKATKEARDLVADVDEVVALTFDIFKRNVGKNDRLALEALNSTYKGRDFVAKLTGAFAPEKKEVTIQEIDISDEELLAKAAALDARRKGNPDRADN